jgi:hypothetical protein
LIVFIRGAIGFIIIIEKYIVFVGFIANKIDIIAIKTTLFQLNFCVLSGKNLIPIKYKILSYRQNYFGG